MKVSIFFSILLLILLFGQKNILARRLAVLEDGRQIILRNNGTWYYKKTRKSGKYSFRKTYWAMKKEAVKKKEKGRLYFEGKNELKYKVNIDTVLCDLNYKFEKDGLVKAVYTLSIHAGNAELWYFLIPLVQKYGDPLYVTKRFNRQGEFKYYKAIWRTNTTVVEITMFERYRLFVSYQNRTRVKLVLPEKKRINVSLDDI